MAEITTDVRSTHELLARVRARVEDELVPETFAHVRRTTELARKLAIAHGVDPDRAELAALLHDVADRYPDAKLLALAEQFGLPISLTEARVPKLLHGKVGAELLRRDWDIDDDEILDAVRYHTTGTTTMSTLAKVLFCADKLEPDRDKYYGGLEPVREIAMVDLDEAMTHLYAWRLSELVQTGLPIDEKSVRARNMLIERMIARWRVKPM